MEENNKTENKETQNKQNKRKPWLAFFFSFITFGLGNIYCGKLKKGILIYVFGILSIILIFYISMLLLPEFFNFIFLSLLLFVQLYIPIDAYREAKKTTKDYKMKIYNKWYIYLIVIFINGYVVFPNIKYVFVEVYKIPTGSMQNTIMVGDLILTNKLAYGIHLPFSQSYIVKYKTPSRGEIVIYEFPGLRDEVKPEETVYYIFRLIALPGDTIKIVNKTVYVNNQLSPFPINARIDSRVMSNKIPDGGIFPIGMNWNEDNYGPLAVPKKGDKMKIDYLNIESWRIFILKDMNHKIVENKESLFVNIQKEGFYEVKKDYFFVMGDNRNNALDSRFTGFIPLDNIVGKPEFVYFSYDDEIKWGRIGLKLK